MSHADGDTAATMLNVGWSVDAIAAHFGVDGKVALAAIVEAVRRELALKARWTRQ